MRNFAAIPLSNFTEGIKVEGDRRLIGLRWWLAVSLSYLSILAFGREVIHVTLTNGDQLSGQLLTSFPMTLTVKHAMLGDLTLQRSQIASLDHPNQDPPKDQPKSSSPAKKPTAKKEVDASKVNRWKKRIDVAFRGERGQQQKHNLGLRFDLKQKEDGNRWYCSLRYLTEERDHRKTRENLQARLERDGQLE